MSRFGTAVMHVDSYVDVRINSSWVRLHGNDDESPSAKTHFMERGGCPGHHSRSGCGNGCNGAELPHTWQDKTWQHPRTQ